MLVKYVSIDGIPQAFVFFRFVDIIVITVHDRFWNVTLKSIPSVFMYAMNIQNDVIGLVLCENCKSKQMTGIIA
jgi:phosphate starvation-inducible membrane PsiE